MAGKFVIKETTTGVKFDLLAENGQVIASSEVYSTLASCKNGIESVMKNAPIAHMEDQTSESHSIERNPKFEMYMDKSEHYRFRLKAKNGEIIATSESYQTKSGCRNGIDSVIKNSTNASVVEAVLK